MKPLVLSFTLICFFFFRCCNANTCPSYNDYDNCRDTGCWIVTIRDQYSFSNGWSYYPTGLKYRNSDAAVIFTLMFLRDQKSEPYWKMSIVAWDTGVGEIADVVWQLNQYLMLNDTLEFEQDGNLLVNRSDYYNYYEYYNYYKYVWATNTNNTGVKRLCLTDYGSFELQNEKNDTLWSSFESPTNKLVCGQVLKNGAKLESGNYTFNVEATRAVLYFGQQPYKTWNLSHGIAPNYAALCCNNDAARLQLRDDTGNISNKGTYLMINRNVSCLDIPSGHAQEILTLYTNLSSVVAVATLGDDGIITATKLSGITSIFQDGESCDLPNVCGKYGLCTTNIAGGRLCSCPGSDTSDYSFQYIDTSNYASGCQVIYHTYRRPGNKHEYNMINLLGVDYYGNKFAEPNTRNSTANACSMNCYNKGSCKAAFFHRPTNSCFLVDEVSLYSFRSENPSYYSVSFKVYTPILPLSIVVISEWAFMASCLAILSGLFIYWRKRYNDKKEEDVLLNTYLSEATLKRYSSKEIKQITHADEKLGAGAFGTVYKGLLPNGIHVAVKTLNGLTQEAKDFYAELSILSRVRHFNLVQLLGFSSSKKSRSLIYEYMENGSLDQWLLGQKPYQLGWEVRMKIATGSARGMAYIHEECAERVLHLDVKPQNILLDKNFNPKVADFGLSRLIDRNESALFMTKIMGTPGYLAPEILACGAISVKCDVYSFGVVLLEILAGSRPIRQNGEEFWNFSKDDNVIKKIVDRRLGASFNLDEARRMLKVSALCINLDPECRPYMSSVVQMLEGTAEIPSFATAPDPVFHPNLHPDVNDKFMKLLESRASSSSSGGVYFINGVSLTSTTTA